MENQNVESLPVTAAPLATETKTIAPLSRGDYFLITFIGLSFGLFAIPILENIQLPFLKLNFSIYAGLIVFFIILANFGITVAHFLGKFVPIIFQFAKFAAVGAFNSFFDWGVLNLLIAVTGIAGGLVYALFKGMSFLLATIGSFFWNKYWTFQDKDNINAKETGKFLLVSFIGLIINVAIAYLVSSYLGTLGIEEKRSANMGAAAATLISLVWNFLGYKFIVFNR